MRDMGDEATARPRWLWAIVGAVALVAAGAGVGWALTTVLTPAEDVLESTPHTYVSVDPGEVRSSIQLNVVAEWASVPVGTNRAAGVVTGVMVAAGDEVTAGSTLYTVGLRPVVVAEGEIPAFRDIGFKTEGPDVAQLQKMLIERGFYAGSADGIAGNNTVTAVKVWQKSLGLPQTGKCIELHRPAESEPTEKQWTNYFESLKSGAACLEEMGYEISPPPSREVFVQSYMEDPWLPHSEALRTASVEEQEDIFASCPPPLLG